MLSYFILKLFLELQTWFPNLPFPKLATIEGPEYGEVVERTVVVDVDVIFGVDAVVVAVAVVVAAVGDVVVVWAVVVVAVWNVAVVGAIVVVAVWNVVVGVAVIVVESLIVSVIAVREAVKDNYIVLKVSIFLV